MTVTQGDYLPNSVLLQLNDGKYHVVRFSRIDNQALLQIDDYQVARWRDR